MGKRGTYKVICMKCIGLDSKGQWASNPALTVASWDIKMREMKQQNTKHTHTPDRSEW